MKLYSKKEIADARQFLQENGYPEQEVTLNGRTFTFFVMPHALNRDLPGFAYRCTGRPGDGYVIGVSDFIRDEFRPFVAAHEYIEYVEIGDRPDRCVRALEEELAIVPRFLKKSYLTMRQEFFTNLIAYLTREQRTSVDDLAEFRKSLARLEALAKQPL